MREIGSSEAAVPLGSNHLQQLTAAAHQRLELLALGSDSARAAGRMRPAKRASVLHAELDPDQESKSL
jgi:hypothetical protein